MTPSPTNYGRSLEVADSSTIATDSKYRNFITIKKSILELVLKVLYALSMFNYQTPDSGRYKDWKT